MSKQNRGLMTNQTKQTKDYMTQEDHEAYDQETQDLILKNMVNVISNDYAEMYNSTPNPIKDVLNQLLMFGEEEGVLVTTAIKKLYKVNQEYKEGK